MIKIFRHILISAILDKSVFDIFILFHVLRTKDCLQSNGKKETSVECISSQANISINAFKTICLHMQ